MLLGLTALLIVARPPSARAACTDHCWTGATSADWFTGTNWTPNTTPGAATNVVIDQGSPNADPTIGINGTSNAASSNAVAIGDLTGTTGLVTLSTTNAHPASWTIGGNLKLGGSGNGAINISNGAQLTNTNGQAQIGANTGGTGTLTIDGVGSLWNEQANGSPIVVGNSGTGLLTITNGAAVETTGVTGNVTIGAFSGSKGTATVGSAASPNLVNPSTLTNIGGASPGSLIVGDGGTGILTINSDGAVSGFFGATIARQAGSQGTLTVNGGSLNVVYITTGDLTVGVAGLGTLLVENGGTVTSGSGTIAHQPGSTGSTATVTGATSTWNMGAGGVTVGNGANGSLSVLAGGTVNTIGGQLTAGDSYGGGNGAGTVLVDNAKLNVDGGFINIGALGGAGSIMTVQDGARVTSSGGQIGSGPFSPIPTGLVTVTGAGSLWDAARDSNGNVDPATSLIAIDNATSMTGLVIQQRGQVISGFGQIANDAANGAVNTVVVDGAGSKWTVLTQLWLGFYSSGGFGLGDGTGVEHHQWRAGVGRVGFHRPVA